MIKNLRTLLFFTPIIFAACSSVDNTSNYADKWEPVFIEGTDKAHQRRAEGAHSYISFSEDGSFNGLAGDNLFRGIIEINSDGTIEKCDFAKTNLSGVNEEYETAFFNAIKESGNLSRADGNIYLYSKDGKLLMQLAPKPVKETELALEDEALETEEAIEEYKNIELLGTKWQVAFLAGSKNHLLKGGDVAFVEFKEEGKINGMSGDNLFKASFYAHEGASAEISDILGTKTLGENEGYESKFLQALENTAKVELDDNKLFFFNEKGKLLVEFKTFEGKEVAKKALILDGSKWKTVFVANTDAEFTSPDDKVPFIEFLSSNSIYGFAGDNIFNGRLSTDEEGNFKVGKLAVTMKMGANGEYETAFIKALNEATKAEIKDVNMLCLVDKKGEVLMSLRPFDYVEDLSLNEKEIAFAELEKTQAEEAALSQGITVEEMQADAEQDALDDAEFKRTEEAAQEFAEEFKEEEERQVALAQAEQEAMDDAEFKRTEEAAIEFVAATEATEAVVEAEAEEAQRIAAEEEAQRIAAEEALKAKTAEGEAKNAKLAEKYKATKTEESSPLPSKGPKKAKKATSIEDLF